MQNPMPLRWIEQAEAREVLTAAAFEQADEPSRRRCAWREMSQQLRQWLPTLERTGAMLLQPQPALVRKPAPGRALRRNEDGDYLRRW